MAHGTKLAVEVEIAEKTARPKGGPEALPALYRERPEGLSRGQMATRSSRRSVKKPVAVSGPRRGRNSAQRLEKLEAIVRQLRKVAEACGFRVRHEKLLREAGYTVRSGRCRLAADEMLVLDSELPPDARIELLLGALGEKDLSSVEMPDEIRRLLSPDASTAAAL